MTREQKERLTAWCLNTIATFRIDYFRGVVLFDVTEYIHHGGIHRLIRAISVCRDAINLCFKPNEESYPELLIELKQIAKDVPLIEETQTAIYHVFGGDGRKPSKPSKSSASKQ